MLRFKRRNHSSENTPDRAQSTAQGAQSTAGPPRRVWRWLGGWLEIASRNAWRSARWGVAICAFLIFVICMVPPLRYALHAQTVGSGAVRSNGSALEFPWTYYFEDRTWSFRRLAKLHPDDVRVLAQASSENPRAFDDGSRYGWEDQHGDVTSGGGFARIGIRDYDALIRRFPRVSWLLAMRANRARETMRDSRIAVAPTYSLAPASPYYYDGRESQQRPKKANYKPTDLSAALDVTRRGGALEPDNAYWDLLHASFLYSARRDTECFQSLAIGARKSRYDDHHLDILRARIEALERVRPLFLEEKLNVSPQDAWADRGAAAFVRALKNPIGSLWKDNRSARALSIQGDLLRIAGLRLQSRSPLYNGIEDGIWLKAIRAATEGLRLTQREAKPIKRLSYQAQIDRRFELESLIFARIARRFGRFDIADATAGQTALALQRQRLVDTREDYYRPRPGVPSATRARNMTVWMLGLATLVQIPILMILWSVLSLLLLRSQPHAAAKVSSWRTRTTFIVAASACGALALLFVALKGNFGQFIVGDFYNRSNPPSPAQTRREHWAIASGIATMFLCVAPAFFGAWLSWFASVWAVWRERKTLLVPPAPRYDGESARIVPPNPLPLMAAFVTWGIVFYAVAAWLLALLAWQSAAKSWSLPLAWFSRDIWMDTDEPLPICLTVAGLTTVFCWFLWPFKWRFASGNRWRERAHGALHDYRRALGWSIAVSCVLYFSLAILRAVIDGDGSRAFETYLQSGDFAQSTPKPRL